MKFFDITLKDLYQLSKDWQPPIFLVAAPILFTIMFGLMFGGFSGPGGNVEDARFPIWIIDEEKTPITESVVDFFGNSEIIRVEKDSGGLDLAGLKQAVEDEEVTAVVILPAGFSQSLHADSKVNLEMIVDENTPAGITTKQAVQKAVNRLETAAKAADKAVGLYSDKAGFSNEDEEEAFYTASFQMALDDWAAPPVTSFENQTKPENDTGTSGENAFAQSLPGMMAQFAIAGLIGASEIIVQERKSGALDRLRGTAVPRLAILSGHWLAMFAMIFVQFIVLITFGQIFLRLNFFSSPGATLILSISSCAFVASLGLLIGILAKMPEQTAVYALIPMFLFAGLGGAWIPLNLLGETVQKVSKFTPVSWIMTGFKDILIRGAGLNEIHLNILILIGFSLIFFIPAALIFYRKQT
jgi:ABC-2 type transport system permease protein